MKSSEVRRRLAAETARIISESGDDDRARALRKAASRLHIRDRSDWPEDDEIVEALAEYQRLFRGEAKDLALNERRNAAIEAMRFFSDFQPRLTGPVLEGSADVHSVVTLHLHADDPEAVARFLIEHRIPVTTRGRRLSRPGGGWFEAPVHAFQADGIGFELLVLPPGCLPAGPTGTSGNGIGPRVDLKGLQKLLRGH